MDKSLYTFLGSIFGKRHFFPGLTSGRMISADLLELDAERLELRLSLDAKESKEVHIVGISDSFLDPKLI